MLLMGIVTTLIGLGAGIELIREQPWAREARCHAGMVAPRTCLAWSYPVTPEDLRK